MRAFFFGVLVGAAAAAILFEVAYRTARKPDGVTTVELKAPEPDCRCRETDAWRCANDLGLPSVLCRCRCHQYLERPERSVR